MNIELLNVRIFITKLETQKDAIGNHFNIGKEYYTCYATVSAEAGNEQTDAGLKVDDSRLDFTIRWCQKASAITSTGFQVTFNTELYDVVAVDHMNHKHKCVKLRCQKARR